MAKLDVVIKSRVFEDYQRDRPKPVQLDAWIEAKSAELQIAAKTIRRFLVERAELLQAQVNIASLTEAQKVAAMLGASRTKAIAVLERGLGATRVRSVRVEGGGEGDPRWKEVTEPDFRERREAAESLVNIWGGFAPQQIEVRHGLVEEMQKLTDEQIVEKLKQARIAAGQVVDTTAERVN